MKKKVRVTRNGKVLFKGSEAAWEIFQAAHHVPADAVIEKVTGSFAEPLAENVAAA